MIGTQKKLILILGVHRSGTSILTAGMHAAGAGLGAFPETQDIDNPDGYFEHAYVRNFNDRLLAHLGASWDNWGFDCTGVDFGGADMAPWRDGAIGLLQSISPSTPTVVVKDPRIATLLPFYELIAPQAGFELSRIVIVRDPTEVMESQRLRVLRAAHDYPVLAGGEPMAALWAVTMHTTLASLSDDNTLLVRHRDLYRDPLGTLTAAAAFAGLSPAPEAIESFTRQTFKSEFRRAIPERRPAVQGSWEDLAMRLYQALTGHAEAPVHLTRAMASAALDAVPQLTATLPLLPAVRSTITRMRPDNPTDQATVDANRLALARALWRGLNPDETLPSSDEEKGAMFERIRDSQILLAEKTLEHLGNLGFTVTKRPSQRG